MNRTICLIALAWASAVNAQAPSPSEIPLYPGAAPGSEKWDWEEKSVTRPNGMPIVTDVVRPVLIHYPAEKDKAVGSAMVVAPGGGFRALMMSYEGADIAKRLNAMGVDAFVLKYRLIHNAPGAPAREDVVKMAGEDGRQAVRLVREKAGEFGYRPDRVGMIGFSAGRHGHVGGALRAEGDAAGFRGAHLRDSRDQGDPGSRPAALPGRGRR